MERGYLFCSLSCPCSCIIQEIGTHINEMKPTDTQFYSDFIPVFHKTQTHYLANTTISHVLSTFDQGTGTISQKGHLTPLLVSFLGLCSFSPPAEWRLHLPCCQNRSLSKQLLLLIRFPSLTLLLEENKTSHCLPDP